MNISDMLSIFLSLSLTQSVSVCEGLSVQWDHKQALSLSLSLPPLSLFLPSVFSVCVGEAAPLRDDGLVCVFGYLAVWVLIS